MTSYQGNLSKLIIKNCVSTKDKMSKQIEICKLNKSQKQYIQDNLVVTTKMGKEISIFDFEDDMVNLPLYFGSQYSDEKQSQKGDFKECIGFIGNLKSEQEKVRNECMKFLSTIGTCILGAQPGFGKTITTIEIICRINVKTMILIKQTVVIEQWLESFQKYAPQKSVQKITSKTKINQDADIFILNPILLKNSDCINSKLYNICKNVKFLILDEVHLLLTEIFMKSLFKIHPFYLLGLSATPRRPKNDPFRNTFDWFFGPHIVERKLFRRHLVYIVKTNFEPDYLKYTPQGLDWNHVLNEQSENSMRNKIIVENILKFPNKIWLVLVKRVKHAEILQTLFKEKNFETELLIGSKIKFNKSCTILIGTTSKIGVGFDHAPINALCIAADVVEYFEQFLGRCMRDEKIEPIVLDFQDKLGVLNKHFYERVKEYKKYGGELMKI